MQLAECVHQRRESGTAAVCIARRTTGYMHCAGLAQHRYFEDAAFVKYLAYLRYWRQPKYSQYIVYAAWLSVAQWLQPGKRGLCSVDPAAVQLPALPLLPGAAAEQYLQE